MEFTLKGGNAIRKMKMWEYAKYRDDFQRKLLRYFLENGRPVVRGRAHIKAVRRYRQENYRLDQMNAVWAFKPIFDVLIKLGVIVDDSEEWLEHEILQEKGKGFRMEIKKIPVG